MRINKNIVAKSKLLLNPLFPTLKKGIIQLFIVSLPKVPEFWCFFSNTKLLIFGNFYFIIEKSLNSFLDKNEEICIYAYPKGTHNREEAKLAAKLIILKNDRSTRKEKKIVLVKIETDIDKNGKNEREDFSLEEKTMLYNALHQALIIPIVEYTTLNLSSNNSEFQIGGDFIADGKIQMTSPTIRERVYNRLQELFFQQNARYRDNYFTIFKFGVESNKDGLLGETQDIKTENVIIFTLPRGNEDYTLAHETLHRLGLYHTQRS